MTAARTLSASHGQVTNAQNRISPVVVAVGAATLAASVFFARSSLRSHGYFDPLPQAPSTPVTGSGNFSIFDPYESDTATSSDKNGIRNGTNLLAQKDAFLTFVEHGIRTTISRESLPSSLDHFISSQKGSAQPFLPLHLRASNIYSGESKEPFQTFSTSQYILVAELLDPQQLAKFSSGEFAIQVRSVSPQDFPSLHGGQCNCGYRAHEDHLKIITNEFTKNLAPGETILLSYPDAGYSQVAQLEQPLPGDAWAIVTIKFAEK